MSKAKTQKLSPRIETLLATDTIRVQAQRMLERSLAGQTHFETKLQNMGPCVDFVVQTIRENYPDLKIPFHSRWGHFRAGKVDRVVALERRLKDLAPLERVRAKIDLVVVSVLLDAGAGMGWRYTEPGTGKVFSKSEGLAVASFHMFMDGVFSSDPKQPLRCDSNALLGLKPSTLAAGFQVMDSNPLVGLEGRMELMHALGRALAHEAPVSSDAGFFVAEGESHRRVGTLAHWYQRQAKKSQLPADMILRGIQLGLGSIWPGRLEIEGFNLGDVWRYEPFGEDFVPFHKLPQWLSYSMIEPLEELGLKIVEVDRLTGLAEYRNGGLFVDMDVLTPRDHKLLAVAHAPGSDVIVEWRALTLALLEQVAEGVRKQLGLNKNEFPLGKVLEGGTWSAGRKIAAKKRREGGPPVQIQSDGTVF